MKYTFRLYIAGKTPNSQRAVKNLEAITRSMSAGSFAVEIIDIYENIEDANEDQVIAIPTLIRTKPEPVIRVIGDLSQLEKVLEELEIYLP